MASDQGNHRIRATNPQVHLAHRGKHIGRIQRQTSRGFIDFVRQYIEQHLGVALGVDVAVVGAEQLCLEGLRIGQVAVVHQHNTKRGVDIKGLGLFVAVGVASGRVAHLAQTEVARQRAHIAGAKHIAHHALGFVHEELAVLLGHDSGGVLPPMLQEQQGVINQLIDGRVTDKANDSTHSFPVRPGKRAAALGQISCKVLRQQGLEAFDRPSGKAGAR